MSEKKSPLDSKDELSRPFLVSMSCHGIFLFGSILWGALNPPIDLGSPLGGEGSGIVAVSGVPINVVRADEVNPVANPTEHTIPAPQERQRATEIAEPDAPEPEAVPIPETNRREAETQQERSIGQRSAADSSENQVNSSQGAAVNSPLFGGAQSGPGVGFGGADGGPFGTRFGAYAQILQRKVSQEWQRTLGQVAGTSSKPVVVSFRILKSGKIDTIRVAQTSGNRSLDYSAFRAISNSNPLRPLPPAMRRQAVTIEMNFRLK